MNIFVLDNNPWQAARYHCDKHVVKMILETAQLLSTAHHVLSPDRLKVEDDAWTLYGRKICGPTHINHPCAVWARTTFCNYRWLAELGIALCSEYTYRYNKVHMRSGTINFLRINPPRFTKEDYTAMTPHVQCMPDECKVENNPVEAYRNYYRTHKRDIAKWKLGNIPEWF
jgi:hypothetical protein